MYLTVKAGKVVNVTGAKQDTDKLNAALLRYENASNIAKFGIKYQDEYLFKFFKKDLLKNK